MLPQGGDWPTIGSTQCFLTAGSTPVPLQQCWEAFISSPSPAAQLPRYHKFYCCLRLEAYLSLYISSVTEDLYPWPTLGIIIPVLYWALHGQYNFKTEVIVLFCLLYFKYEKIYLIYMEKYIAIICRWIYNKDIFRYESIQ